MYIQHVSTWSLNKLKIGYTCLYGAGLELHMHQTCYTIINLIVNVQMICCHCLNDWDRNHVTCWYSHLTFSTVVVITEWPHSTLDQKTNRSSKITIVKNYATRTPLKSRDTLMCSGGVNSFCSTSTNSLVIIFRNLIKKHHKQCTTILLLFF